MKVKELIRKLQKCNQESVVVIDDQYEVGFEIEEVDRRIEDETTCVYTAKHGDPLGCVGVVILKSGYELSFSEHECDNGNHSGHHTPECRVGKERKDCWHKDDPRVKSHGKH